MRAIMTGQVGMNKKQYVEDVAQYARDEGDSIQTFHVGDMMYAEGRDISPGRILDLPWSRLSSLRRAAFKDIMAQSEGVENVIVNTHATFRWRHGLFSAFDFDQIAQFDPDMFICLVDNIEVVHHNLHGEHTIDATLKDCMVWREEEILATELAMVIFHSLGRHPFAGMAAAFAGVSGGYSANLLIGTVDPLLSGITEEAARYVDPAYEVHPAVNWYFMIASTFLITILGWFVTEKIVEPRLGKYDVNEADESVDHNPKLDRVTKEEVKGLWAALVSVVVISFGFVVIAGPNWLSFLDFLPGFGYLRNTDPDARGAEAFRPMLRSVVTMIFVFFVVPGFVYGRIVGTMKNDRDIIDAMADAMKSMGLYIVLVFFAAQFVAFFGHSGLGQILAVLGADALVAMNLDNPLVFIPFILMCCFVNLMLGSASAQWAVTAPIFVPMLMTIGYSPEVIQAAYRIGDSTTNIITPMMSYFGLILAVATRYKKDLGIGTMVATMLPYTIFFLIGWMILFYVWVFALGLPVGPGAPTHYPAG